MDNINEVLSSVNDYLYNLTDAIIKVTEKINNDEEQEGLALIPDIAEGMDWVIQVVKFTSDYTKIQIDDEEIDSKISSIVEALGNEDNTLVADLFNYEILPLFNEIHNEIRKILE